MPTFNTKSCAVSSFLMLDNSGCWNKPVEGKARINMAIRLSLVALPLISYLMASALPEAVTAVRYTPSGTRRLMVSTICAPSNRLFCSSSTFCLRAKKLSFSFCNSAMLANSLSNSCVLVVKNWLRASWAATIRSMLT